MTAPPGGPYGQDPYGANPYGQGPYWGGPAAGRPPTRPAQGGPRTRTRRRWPRPYPSGGPYPQQQYPATRPAVSARLAHRGRTRPDRRRMGHARRCRG